MDNIEKSAFRRGEYVGYANGVWLIKKTERGWQCAKRDGKFDLFYARTLKEASAILTKRASEE